MATQTALTVRAAAFLFNALGGISWAVTFGVGGYLLDEAFISSPVR